MKEDRNGGAVAQHAIAIGVDVLVEDGSDGELFEKVLDDGVRTKAMDLQSFLPHDVFSSKDRGSFLLIRGARGSARCA